MNKIKPKLLKGTQEYLPIDMAKRNLVMSKIRQIFERFGYDNIETPTLNLAETILGKYGEEGDKLSYSFEDKGGRSLALPYDQTVPFARLVAANWSQLPMPFKRYQMQKVWRADKPQKGRQREFYQCDIDIIGTRSLICEAEVAKVVYSVFSELGFQKFEIKFNSRRLLNSVLESFRVQDNVAAIRIIDKYEKIGEEKVVAMLKEIGIKDAKGLIDLLAPAKSNLETLKKLSRFDSGEISEFLKLCGQLNVPDVALVFDPRLARGLDYYTGISFEIYSEEAPFGALCAGGRYDDLCKMFCDKDFSGVGVAFGFARIMLGLERMGKLDDVRLASKALVTVFEGCSADSMEIYSELSEAGINSEIYFEEAKLSKQFKYADKKMIPFVVICGPEEKEKNEVVVKSMATGKQKAIPRNQLTNYLTTYYEG